MCRACGWETSRARARSFWVAFASDVPTLWNCSAAKPDGARAERVRGLVPGQRGDPAQSAVLQFQGVGQGRAALVHHQRDTLAREASLVEQSRDAPEAGWQLVAGGDVARVDVVAQAQTVLAVEGVTEPDLAQAAPQPLVCAALPAAGPEMVPTPRGRDRLGTSMPTPMPMH